MPFDIILASKLIMLINSLLEITEFHAHVPISYTAEIDGCGTVLLNAYNIKEQH